MGALSLKHKENILYREDDLETRIRLLHVWTFNNELTLDEFKVLLKSCTQEQVEIDNNRKHPHEKTFDQKSNSNQYH